MDNICKSQVSGETIIKLLENSVCKWPAMEGRFAQISGMCFSFDPKLDPGHRV